MPRQPRQQRISVIWNALSVAISEANTMLRYKHSLDDESKKYLDQLSNKALKLQRKLDKLIEK